jgi:hypothetical protein
LKRGRKRKAADFSEEDDNGNDNFNLRKFVSGNEDDLDDE